MSDKNPLTKLDYLTEVLVDAERLRAQYVAEARGNGESWQAIAVQMNVSKQAAQERYGKTKN